MLLRLSDAIVATRPLAAPVSDDDLSAGERGLADAAASDARRQELRAARATARDALRALDPPLASRSVLRAPDGQPRLDPPGDWHVSIAHDGSLAVAAVSRSAVGVDVMPNARAEQASRVVRARIESGRAVDLATDRPLPFDRELLLWTAWEALGKQAGDGVLVHMRRSIAPAAGDGCLEALVDGAHVRWLEVDAHVICLATTR